MKDKDTVGEKSARNGKLMRYIIVIWIESEYVYMYLYENLHDRIATFLSIEIVFLNSVYKFLIL